jgi:DNA/RNA endonuclease G (NUC1)
MTVPSGYFKAILKYSKSSTLGQWNAAGFYYKHESGAKQQMMSIDQLEEMTGIDFFVNLSAKIGADQAVRLEAAIPSTSVWQ